MRLPRASSLESNINVTPLVDVCLVLLIIFMVVTPMMVNGPVELPRTNTGQTQDEKAHPVAITVKSDGSVYIDALVVRGDQVTQEMQSMHDRWPNRAIAVRGDKRASYGAVADVLEACRNAGYHDIGLISLRRE